MPRTSLIAICTILLLTALPAAAAESCGDRLRAFNLYEVMDEGKVEMRHALFPPMDWSDASAFHGIVSSAAEATLEVMVEGKKKDFAFVPWERDPSLFVADGFHAKKFFRNAESGGFFTLRLKQDEKVICEERHEISGD